MKMDHEQQMRQAEEVLGDRMHDASFAKGLFFGQYLGNRLPHYPDLRADPRADAKVEELQAVIDDSTIKSPVRGRVQYRLVEPGAVLPAGGKIATVIDLSDVYTTIYLPGPQAGRLKIGDDARVVVDASPEYVFPATVSRGISG